TLAATTPEGEKWIHEIKFDGYRMLCQLKAQKATFVSRNGKDWTAKFPNLKRESQALSVQNAIIDGEVVILDDGGRSSFQAMQNAFQAGSDAPFIFYVFDLLYLNGLDLRPVPIEERKAILRRIVPEDAASSIKYSDHVVGNGETLFAEAARLQLEG